ncbi:MAG: hypothetical protein A2Y62_14500 [Candidatus Fischerbacteria bacterium RBG_13_37_8]|uniref:Steroid 5-alpha reductase C-terminal domain-containing protein n=1 Tax=Candidatus Fischerbacteria bacterium RBG_13_37_8 TaxID=1817863 RepID=A0A1F5VNP4_9BACT|nr:MAG: hypothetical protein A2Y62_14500 [Candidatus Fischerbacteria bacterium RBG_13_37_8]
MEKLKQFFHKHHQWIINVVLFICIGQYIYRETEIYQIFKNLKFIDITFFTCNIIFLLLILIRRNYRKVDTSWTHWLVATASFFSSMFFMKSHVTVSQTVHSVANGINALAIIVNLIALLSLGRSFGIVPALRIIKTRGAYRVIRHLMYVSDILLKTPILLIYFSVYNLAIYLFSVILYILRAHFEEQILQNDSEYNAYMQKVKYRFIPFIY